MTLTNIDEFKSEDLMLLFEQFTHITQQMCKLRIWGLLQTNILNS